MKGTKFFGFLIPRKRTESESKRLAAELCTSMFILGFKLENQRENRDTSKCSCLTDITFATKKR